MLIKNDFETFILKKYENKVYYAYYLTLLVFADSISFRSHGIIWLWVLYGPRNVCPGSISEIIFMDHHAVGRHNLKEKNRNKTRKRKNDGWLNERVVIVRIRKGSSSSARTCMVTVRSCQSSDRRQDKEGRSRTKTDMTTEVEAFADRVMKVVNEIHWLI